MTKHLISTYILTLPLNLDTLGLYLTILSTLSDSDFTNLSITQSMDLIKSLPDPSLQK